MLAPPSDRSDSEKGTFYFFGDRLANRASAPWRPWDDGGKSRMSPFPAEGLLYALIAADSCNMRARPMKRGSVVERLSAGDSK
jgi:hypothetical protein